MSKQTRTAIILLILSGVSTLFVLGSMFFNTLFVEVDPDIALYTDAIDSLELQNTELADLVSTLKERELEYQLLIEAANLRIEALQSTSEAARLQSENEALWAEVTRLQAELESSIGNGS